MKSVRPVRVLSCTIRWNAEFGQFKPLDGFGVETSRLLIAEFILDMKDS